MKTVMIKIDRSSVKKNPKYGHSVKSYVQREASFSCKGSLPNFMIDGENVHVITETFQQGKGKEFTGVIVDPENAIEWMQQLTKDDIKKHELSISINNNISVIDGILFGKWNYAYEPKKVKCSSCKKSIIFDEIEEEWDSDGEDDYKYTVCPNCHATNSFPELEFEKIEDVVAEMKLS